jgi:hypothetical protein
MKSGGKVQSVEPVRDERQAPYELIYPRQSSFPSDRQPLHIVPMPHKRAKRSARQDQRKQQYVPPSFQPSQN